MAKSVYLEILTNVIVFLILEDAHQGKFGSMLHTGFYTLTYTLYTLTYTLYTLTYTLIELVIIDPVMALVPGEWQSFAHVC